MHYDRITRLIMSCLRFLFGPALYIVQVIIEAVPILDAKTSLAADRLVSETSAMTVKRSRFRAFVERALSHDNYASGHFDPGRSAA